MTQGNKTDRAVTGWLLERLSLPDWNTVSVLWEPHERAELKKSLTRVDPSDTETAHQVFLDQKQKIESEQASQGFDKAVIAFFHEYLFQKDFAVIKKWKPEEQVELKRALQGIDPFDAERVHEKFVEVQASHATRDSKGLRKLLSRSGIAQWLQPKK